MSSGFECAWESVRPVPRVTIDFGDGHTLERTLHGNIVTYFCTAQGEVYDLVPGLVDADEYLRRLEQALRLERAALGRAEERPALAAGTGPTFPPAADPAAAQGLLEWKEIVRLWHRELLVRAAAEEPLTRDPILVMDFSKTLVERRLDDSLAPPVSTGDAGSLRRDTELNRRHRYPLASALWLERPFAQPADIAREVYRRVLGVDLDDPYLGLAPDVLGGEGGRRVTEQRELARGTAARPEPLPRSAR